MFNKMMFAKKNPLKAFLLCSSIIWGFQSFAQNKDEIHYSGVTISKIIVDLETNQAVRNTVMGTDVKITYNKVFKSYLIEYKEDTGKRNRLFFHYLKDYSYYKDGKLLHDGLSVYTDNGTKYYVLNQIDENGKLTFQNTENSQGVNTWMEIDSIKLN